MFVGDEFKTAPKVHVQVCHTAQMLKMWVEVVFDRGPGCFLVCSVFRVAGWSS